MKNLYEPVHPFAKTRARNVHFAAALAVVLSLLSTGAASGAITFLSSNAVNNTNTVALPASQISIPVAAVTAGNVLVAQIVIAKDLPTTNVICPPDSSWVSIFRSNHNPSSGSPSITKFSQQVFYSVVTANAAAGNRTFTFRAGTCAGSLVARGASGGIVRLGGVDTADPYDTHDVGGLTSSSGTTATAPTVTTALNDAAVLRFYAAFKSTTFSSIFGTQLWSVGSTNNSSERTAAAFQQVQPTAGSTGTATATIGTSAEWLSATVALNAAPSNTPPTLTNVPASASICELAPYTFDANASDSDVPAQTLTFSLQGTIPTGAGINSSTGVFTWTPAENQDGGPYSFKVRVTDSGAPVQFTEQTVALTVLEANTAPELDPIGDQTVVIGDLLTFDANASDDDFVGGVANTLTYSLEGTVPAGASIDSSTGVFSWTPAIGQDGDHTITVRVTDNGPGNTCGTASLSDEETITVTVRRQTYFLGLDADAISAGAPPNNFSTGDVNEGIAGVGQRLELAWFAANEDAVIGLPSGQVGDEGWFGLKTILASWDAAGPTADGLRNLLLAGPGLGSGSDPEALLDGVPNVTPLRYTGLDLLVGHQVCAVVWKSDISIGYGPLTGSLKGDNRGIVAFEVDDVTAAGSGSTLPLVTIRVSDAAEVCGEPLRLFTQAPAPISSSEPFDVDGNP